MIKTEISVPVDYTEENIKCAVSEHLPIEKSEILDLKIVKRTLIPSDKNDIKYKMSVGISLSPEREAGLLKMRKKVFPYEDYSLEIPEILLSSRPVVVGSGPCGLFAALTLAKAGARPLVLERGLKVEERQKKVECFTRLGILDTECNIQFGEGGAGTFSDGKLKVGSMDKYKWEVLTEFVSAGANEDIMFSVGAHLGTDRLTGIVKSLREKIISLGGEFIFGARLSSLGVKNGKIASCDYIKDGKRHTIETENVILAIGHSANDTFRMLYEMGISMEARGFGVGMRIEHKREYIDELCYGKNAPEALGSASYHLVTHLPSGRSVYSFCMCPGGTVVSATSEEGSVVTNGMSEYARNAENSNSALLVSVTPADFKSTSALAGLEYRRKIEKAAFLSAGESYSAPATRLDSFLKGEKSKEPAEVLPSFAGGVRLARPEEYLPNYISDSLRLAMSDFDAWLPGFNYGGAVLTGAETRSTSPIRILRTESFEALGASGLYPAGEGAGYAGGIVSSATDGVRVAIMLLSKNKPSTIISC